MLKIRHPSDNKTYITSDGDVFCSNCVLRHPTCVIHNAGCCGAVYTSDSSQPPELVTTTENQNVVTRRCNTLPPTSTPANKRAECDVTHSDNSCAKLARMQ